MVNAYKIWKGDKSWIFDNAAALRVISAYTQVLYINKAEVTLTSLVMGVLLELQLRRQLASVAPS